MGVLVTSATMEDLTFKARVYRERVPLLSPSFHPLIVLT